MLKIPYIITDNAVTVYTVNDGPLTVNKDEHTSAYEAACEALRAEDEEALFRALSPAQTIKHAFAKTQGHEIEIRNNQLLLDGNVLDNYTAAKALEMANANLDVTPLLNFIARCANNPSFRAVNELYNFLEYGNMPLTPDGYFLAYKRVRDNYRDVHSGTIDNTVGSVVSMARNQVDDNSENTCSYGLHFCSFEYLYSFAGSRIMVLKIDPADVVSIPKDYNNTKGRCARYTVVDEQEVPTRWSDPVVYEYDDDDIDDDDIDDDDIDDDGEDGEDSQFQASVRINPYGEVFFKTEHFPERYAGRIKSGQKVSETLFFETPEATMAECNAFVYQLMRDSQVTHGEIIRDFYATGRETND